MQMLLNAAKIISVSIFQRELVQKSKEIRS